MLEEIVGKYKQLIRSWNIRDNLLKEKPTLNGQIVSEEYYIEQLKNAGYQLVRENKYEDGFMPAKEIWKKAIREDINKGVKEVEQINSEATTSFQRKIDPSLDDIYSFRVKGSTQN